MYKISAANPSPSRVHCRGLGGGLPVLRSLASCFMNPQRRDSALLATASGQNLGCPGGLVGSQAAR